MLIGTELITEFVEVVIHTGFLTTDPPSSAMLIASPESGKTSIVAEKNCRSVLPVSDMIGSGLLQELAQKPFIRHVVINDMLAVMAHKPETNARTFAILSSLTDEGLAKVVMPGGLASDFGGRRMGVICCVPSELMKDNRRWWNSTGFSSRCIPFNYELSEALQMTIKKETIVTGAYEKKGKSEKFKIPTHNYEVAIEERFAKKIQSIADEAAHDLDEKGMRKGKQFRALARARALRYGRPSIDESEIDFLKKISRHISYQVTAELREYKKYVAKSSKA